MADLPIAEPHEGGLSVSIQRRGIFGSRTIPRDQWASLRHPLPTYAAALIKRGSAKGDAIILKPLEAAALPRSIAMAISAPPQTTHAPRLAFKDRAESPNGRVDVEWRDKNTRRITVKREGALLRHGNEVSRLSPDALAMLEAVDAYNATQGQDPLERIAAWTPLQAILKGVTGREYATDAYIESLTIYQAGAIAIDMTETASGLAFEPVLMEKRARTPASDETDAPEDGEPAETEARDQGEGILLTPAQQAQFAEAARRSGRARKAYSVGRNAFVVLAPEVEVALGVIASQAHATREERREFARNPRAAFARAISEAGLGSDFDEAGAIFVETAQYSDRVVEFGLWDRSDIPSMGHKGTGGGMLDGVDFGDGSGAKAPAPSPEGASAGRRSASGGPVQMLLTKNNTRELGYKATVRPRKTAVPPELPSDLMTGARPKPHQSEGVAWMMDAWRQGHPGVLLADDMGLGKTFQALVFAAWLRRAMEGNAPGPIIIIAPTALLKNWLKEAAKYLLPDVLGPVVKAFGTGTAALRKAARLSGRGDSLDLDALRAAGLILTTYETMADNHLAFSKVPVALAIFDEIQKIKDPRTINAAAALTINADFLLALTGTPVENRMEDLWTIMDRVWPGFLGSLKEFSAAYGKAEEDSLRRLKALLDQPNEHGVPIMLRRMKKDHIQGLPKRTFHTYPTPMPAIQHMAYDTVLEDAKKAGREQGAALRTVQRLGIISMHPMRPSKLDPYDRRQAEEWFAASARTIATLSILKGIQAAGEKAVVFIDDHHMQDMFTAATSTLFGMPIEPAVINGDVPGEKRQDMVDEFEARGPGFDVLVLSPRAAGVGLTIVSANHVIHVSRWWNPAVEDQCNDRVYRIGQTKPVKVHIPMAIHPVLQDKSYDRNLDALLEGKRWMSQNLFAPPVSEGAIGDLYSRALQGH